jgi:S-adenosylmethionine decarboxylase proenzyme
MLRIVWLVFCFCNYLIADEVYDFRGKHFLASYLECDQEVLKDPEAMKTVMLEAAKECGATVLDYTAYVFPGNGLTMVIMLSESHASIHTYPEHNACFVDLFTCGERANHEIFNQVLQNHLQSKKVNHKVFLRHQDVEELRP